MHRHSGRCGVGMGSHDPDDAANASIQACSNYPENYVLAGKDPGNLGMYAVRARGIFHDANGGDSALLHQLCNFTNSCFRGHCRWLRARIHDCGEIGKRGLFTEAVDICEHGGCLRISGHAGTELRLYASEGIVELLGRRRATFDLVEGLVEDFGNIEQTDDIAFLITNGL